mgnify:CR=1 FL=1
MGGLRVFFSYLIVLIISISVNQKANSETLFEPLGFAALDVLETQDLADLSGRDNLTNVQSIQELDASVSNSTFTVGTMLTGAITIEQHALDHFAGVGLFNVFTGNNNAVNSAVGISIYLAE